MKHFSSLCCVQWLFVSPCLSLLASASTFLFPSMPFSFNIHYSFYPFLFFLFPLFLVYNSGWIVGVSTSLPFTQPLALPSSSPFPCPPRSPPLPFPAPPPCTSPSFHLSLPISLPLSLTLPLHSEISLVSLGLHSKFSSIQCFLFGSRGSLGLVYSHLFCFCRSVLPSPALPYPFHPSPPSLPPSLYFSLIYIWYLLINECKKWYVQRMCLSLCMPSALSSPGTLVHFSLGRTKFI